MITHTSPAAKIVEEVIKSMGAFAKYLATHIVTQGGVPGLAAMEPDGEFVTTINSTQPGQITPEHANYYAITSSFKSRLIDGEHQPKELPLRLVLALADGFVDRLMNAINDLVVDTPSMTAIDTTVGKFIKDELNLPENPAVYHTNYFTRPEVAEAIARWLHLPSPSAVIGLSRGHETSRDRVSGRRWTELGGVVKPDIPAAVNTDILVVDAEDLAAETRAAVEKIAPKYVVIRREGGLYDYAFSADEILESSLPTPDITIDSVMDLHESTASPTLSVSQAVDYAFDMPGLDRMVVLDEDRPVGVIRSANDLLTSDQLGDLAARNISDIGRGVFFGGANDTLTGTRVIQPVSTPVKPEAENVTCPFFAEMDNEIIVNRVTTVEVIIARETIERELGPTAAGGGPGVIVETKRKLIVQVIPRAHCEVVGEDRAEVDVPPPGSPLHLYFDARPTHLGEGAVWVLIRQGQVPLVTLVLSPRIVQERQRGFKRTSAEALAQEPSPLKHSLHQLRITEQFRGDQFFYEYELSSPDLGLFDRFQSKFFQADRQEFVNKLYQEIEGRWLGSGQDKELFQADLRAFGGSLFDELIPDGLQRLLWKHRKDIDSIMVISTEPSIPWELVHLKDPDKRQLTPETLFLAQLGLVRWLHGSWPPDKIRIGRTRYVIPNYPDAKYALPQTKEEKRFLEQKLGGKPVEPQPLAVKALLGESGSFDRSIAFRLPRWS